MKLDALKKVVQDIVDSNDMEKATDLLVKYNLERGRPTHFFFAMMKKHRKTAQFCSLFRTIIEKNGEEVEEVLDKQADIEDEVHSYYEKLYKQREVEHSKEKITAQIGPDIKKISEHEYQVFRKHFTKYFGSGYSTWSYT